MLQFATPISRPVKTLWYDCPDKTRVTSPDAHALYDMCTKHGVTDSYRVWYPKMVHAICLAIEPSACIGSDDGGQRTDRLTFEKIRGGLFALLSVTKSLIKGEPIHVSQQEADRRGSICVSCRYNSSEICAGCSGIIYIADKFLNGREVRDQHKLNACLICSCYLPSTCFASEQVLARTDSGHVFPDHCWRKKK